jgi:hypothetical protein
MGNLKSFFKVRRDVLRAEGKFKATGVVYQARALLSSKGVKHL